MKKIIAILGGVFALVACLLAANSTKTGDEAVCGQMKIGTISSQKLTEGYYKIRALNQELENSIGAAQKELSTMMEGFEKDVSSFHELKTKTENPALTEDAKGKLKKELDEKAEALKQKENAIMDFKVNSEQRIAQKRAEEGSKITNNIRGTVALIAKEKGISFVIDGDNPVVFFTSDKIDLSEEVLVKLNVDQPKAPSTEKK